MLKLGTPLLHIKVHKYTKFQLSPISYSPSAIERQILTSNSRRRRVQVFVFATLIAHISALHYRSELSFAGPPQFVVEYLPFKFHLNRSRCSRVIWRDFAWCPSRQFVFTLVHAIVDISASHGPILSRFGKGAPREVLYGSCVFHRATSIRSLTIQRGFVVGRGSRVQIGKRANVEISKLAR